MASGRKPREWGMEKDGEDLEMFKHQPHFDQISIKRRLVTLTGTKGK